MARTAGVDRNAAPPEEPDAPASGPWLDDAALDDLILQGRAVVFLPGPQRDIDGSVLHGTAPAS
ncbi:MAG: hypothetical protein M0Z63_12765 [Actinomycetota bacterium]|nr:hypothetical protein [Actinomycetota bacterium]MDA8281264.1 hypothetical protein [Actinomycetota bacterium]